MARASELPMPEGDEPYDITKRPGPLSRDMARIRADASTRDATTLAPPARSSAPAPRSTPAPTPSRPAPASSAPAPAQATPERRGLSPETIAAVDGPGPLRRAVTSLFTRSERATPTADTPAPAATPAATPPRGAANARPPAGQTTTPPRGAANARPPASQAARRRERSADDLNAISLDLAKQGNAGRTTYTPTGDSARTNMASRMGFRPEASGSDAIRQKKEASLRGYAEGGAVMPQGGPHKGRAFATQGAQARPERGVDFSKMMANRMGANFSRSPGTGRTTGPNTTVRPKQAAPKPMGPVVAPITGRVMPPHSPMSTPGAPPMAGSTPPQPPMSTPGAPPMAFAKGGLVRHSPGWSFTSSSKGSAGTDRYAKSKGKK